VFRTDPWQSSVQHAHNPELIFLKTGKQNTLRMLLLYTHKSLNPYCSCRDQLIRTFIMDGNFSAEHMRHRTGDKDVSLSAGTAFMANPDSYKAHLRSGKEIVQVFWNSLINGPGSHSNSQAHVIPTGRLNKPIRQEHILMSLALVQQPVAMDSLSQHLW
jgi:hypothetical protein